jgi:glycosyltransferase involved in cell wall biosynthesis
MRPRGSTAAGKQQETIVSRPTSSVVVPAYNEGHRLPDALPRIIEVVRAHELELLVVDDGSSDDTAALAETALAGVEHASVLRLAENSGKGAAVRAGVLAAKGEKIVYMDADLATSLDSLPGMLDALDSADVAVGSRAAPGAVVHNASLKRIVMGRCYNRLVRIFTDISLRDTQCGFKGYRAEAARQLYELSTVDGFGFDVEVLALAYRLRLRIVEVPVEWTAIEGTRVRPLADAVKMTRDLVRTAREVKHTALPEPATENTGPEADALPA